MVPFIVLVLFGVLVYAQANVADTLYQIGYLLYQLIRLPIDELNQRTKPYQYLLFGGIIAGVLLVMIGVVAPYKWDKSDPIYSDMVGRFAIVTGIGLILLGVWAVKVIFKLLVQYIGVAVNVASNVIDKITAALNKIRVPFTSNPNASYQGWHILTLDTTAFLAAVDAALKPVFKTICVIGALLFIAPNMHMLMWYLGLMLVLGFLADTALKDYTKFVVGFVVLVMGINAIMYNQRLVRSWSPLFNVTIGWLEATRDWSISWIIWDTQKTHIEAGYYAKVTAPAPLLDSTGKNIPNTAGGDLVLSVNDQVLVVNPEKEYIVLGSETYYRVRRQDRYGEFSSDNGSGYVSSRKLERVNSSVASASSGSTSTPVVGSSSSGGGFSKAYTGSGLMMMGVLTVFLMLGAGFTDKSGPKIVSQLFTLFAVIMLVLTIFGVVKWFFESGTFETPRQRIGSAGVTLFLEGQGTSQIFKEGSDSGLFTACCGKQQNEKEIVHFVTISFLFCLFFLEVFLRWVVV